MNCAMELNYQKTRLEIFLREPGSRSLRIVKKSFNPRLSCAQRLEREVEILQEQIGEMESTFCHPEALLWLRRSVDMLESGVMPVYAEAAASGGFRIFK